MAWIRVRGFCVKTLVAAATFMLAHMLFLLPTNAANAPSPWAALHVARAAELGIMPQNFGARYNAPITRAEFSMLAVMLFEQATGRTITGRVSFVDTNDVNVQKMGYLGVVHGVGDGMFYPNGEITRQEAAVILSRLAYALESPLPQAPPTFADNGDIALWAWDAVGQVLRSEIMTGVDGNRFDPEGRYTREQSVVTLVILWDLVFVEGGF